MSSLNVKFCEQIEHLQDIQHASETQRLQLEANMNAYAKSDERFGRLKAARLQSYWQQVCERADCSEARNQQLLADLDRVEGHMATLEERSLRRKAVLKQYEDYVEKMYPNWKEKIVNRERQYATHEEDQLWPQQQQQQQPQQPQQPQPQQPQQPQQQQQQQHYATNGVRRPTDPLPSRPPPSPPLLLRAVASTPHAADVPYPAAATAPAAPGQCRSSDELALSPGELCGPADFGDFTHGDGEHNAVNGRRKTSRADRDGPREFRDANGAESNRRGEAQTNGFVALPETPADDVSRVRYTNPAAVGRAETRVGGHAETHVGGRAETHVGGHAETRVAGHATTRVVDRVEMRVGGRAETRVGGHAETRSIGHAETRVSGHAETRMVDHGEMRVGGHVETRLGDDVETRLPSSAIDGGHLGTTTSSCDGSRTSVIGRRESSSRDELSPSRRRDVTTSPDDDGGNINNNIAMTTRPAYDIRSEDVCVDQQPLVIVGPLHDKEVVISSSTHHLASCTSPASSQREEAIETEKTRCTVADSQNDIDRWHCDEIQPDITMGGLYTLLASVEQNFSASLHDVYYRADMPSPSVFTEIFQNANRGSSLSHLDSTSLSMAVLDQLPLLTLRCEGGCLLPDSLLTRPPEGATDQLVRSRLHPSSHALWGKLVAHFIFLMRHRVLTAEEIGCIFGLLLISDQSPYDKQAARLLTDVLRSVPDADLQPSPGSTSTFSTLPTSARGLLTRNNTSDDERPLNNSVHMPQVEEDRADDGNGDDENDDFFSQPIGQTETSNQLTQSAAYKQMLGGTASTMKSMSYEESESDDDDDIEGHLNLMVASKQKLTDTEKSGKDSDRLQSPLSTGPQEGLGTGKSVNTDPLSLNSTNKTSKLPAAYMFGSSDTDEDVMLNDNSKRDIHANNDDEGDEFDFYD